MYSDYSSIIKHLIFELRNIEEEKSETESVEEKDVEGEKTEEAKVINLYIYIKNFKIDFRSKRHLLRQRLRN